MNRAVLARIVPAILGLLVLAYGVFFAWSWFAFTDEQYLPAFRAAVATRRALVLELEWIVPVVAAAVVAASSLAPPSARRGIDAPLPFARIASSAVVSIVLVAAGSLVLSETLGTSSRRLLDELAMRSRLAREYQAQGQRAEQEKRWGDAASSFAASLAIDPSNAVIQQKKLDADTNAAQEEVQRQKSSPAPPSPPTGVDAAALLAKARVYFDRKDWFSAHAYASLAVGSDPRRLDAARLAAQAMERIQAVEPDRLDAAARTLFLAKKAAYDSFGRGDYLDAYFRFQELAAGNPRDAEVKELLARSVAKLEERVFFLDEVERVRAVPGVRNLLFINRAATDGVEVVWIGRMAAMAVVAEGGEPAGVDTFCFDVEAVRYRPTGEVLWHFTAPYALVERRPGEDDQLLMHAVDRNNRAIAVVPRYLAGSRPAAERSVLSIRPSAEELAALSVERLGFADIGLVELWRLRQRLGAFGRMRAELDLAFALRAASPFVLLLLSLLALGLGWSLRARWPGRAPLLAGVAVPLIAAAAAVAALLLQHAHRVLLAFLVLAAGLPATLATAAVLELVLVTLSLVLLAGQSASS